MEGFKQIPGGRAIIRQKGGLLKEVNLFSRAGRVFIPLRGGYIRICAKLGDSWLTAESNTSVIDITQDVPGLFVTGEPKWIEA
jgi:hypothetical protein